MIFVVASIIAITICALHYLINEKPFEKSEPLELSEPFVISEYYDRMEKAALDILENQDPVDKMIILWWGLDGLRLNEDGSLEWISRKKKPVKQDVSFTPCQTGSLRAPFDMCQSAQATREQLFNLNMQLQMANFNAAMQNQINGFNSALQSFVVQTPAYQIYPSYINAGSAQLSSQLTGFCCDQRRF